MSRDDFNLQASPRLKPLPRHLSEEEEELEANSNDEAEKEHEGKDVSDDENRLPLPRRPWDPIKEACWIAVAILWTRSRDAIALARRHRVG
jgi:hypothetical protein